jgi:hypothetical protein
VSRWWRCYADTHRNPKIAKLSDSDFRLWHNLLCIAAENDGIVPAAGDLKHVLNRRLDHLLSALKRLVNGGLIDQLGAGYTPRNWNERQYKSDSSAERTREYRKRRDVTATVTVTPPDTETEADTEKEEEGNGGKPPASYAFFGRVVRLKPQDLDRWRIAFSAIPDIMAELYALDAWLDGQPEAKRKGWFHVVAGSLNRKHQEMLASKRKDDGYDPNVITV